MSGRESESKFTQAEGTPATRTGDFDSVYETVLNLKESMGRLDERSRSQAKKLDEVSAEVKALSRIVLKAQTIGYILTTVIGGAIAVAGWFLHLLILVFQEWMKRATATLPPLN